MEAGVEAGRGVHYQDEVGWEVADHVADQDGPDCDGEVDLLVSHPAVVLHCLVSHHRAVNVPDNADDPEVAVGDEAVREGWDKYSDEVRETLVPASAREDGAGTWVVFRYQLEPGQDRGEIQKYPPVSSMYPSLPQTPVAGNIRKQDGRRQLATERRYA